MVNAVYDHIVAILVVCVIFVGAVVVLPRLSIANIQEVDQQQLRNTALNVFNTMLLDTGYPISWGSMKPFYANDPRVVRFGLASAKDTTFYVLDPDKVQRLVVGNPLNYCDYTKVRELLGLQDYGFLLRIVPPFNVTFNKITVVKNQLLFNVSIFYLDGTPIPNAEAYATAVYTKGAPSKDKPNQQDDTKFGITQAGPVYSNALGVCIGVVNLDFDNPDYYTVVLRVTVSNVATLVVTSGQDFENKIARVNVVNETVILTSWKDPPDYNFKPNENVWILDIVSFNGRGSIWHMFKGGKNGNDNMFNTGNGPFERWSRPFGGLNNFQPVIFVFNFWAVDNENQNGRSQVLIYLAYPNLLSTNVFQYGGVPRNFNAVIKTQRSVIISGMTYTAELWLWKETS
ncbi:MAG: hypothetical protein QW717_03515 [Candidatus Bathyarchaeia archaeon]